MNDLENILNRHPRKHMTHLPTAIHPLNHLSKQTGGSQLWIKRDDRTGLAMGGNKARKLEFLIADALETGADTLITAGGPQSNHCRQTAAAATLAGLECHLVLGGSPPDAEHGNLILDHLLGAHLHWTSPSRRSRQMQDLAEELKTMGRQPYIIPVGGSNLVGTRGYVLAMLELKQQMQEMDIHIDTIVFATSSGGTHAGLTVGAKALDMDIRLLGISIDRVTEGPESYALELAELATQTAHGLDLDFGFSPDDFDINTHYLGEGYGVMGNLERDAIITMARSETIMLDPVYTGRAMGGLLDLLEKGVLSPKQSILFWHTGGAPALFAYGEGLI
jgi:D-cysteine desulfhydrase